MTTTERLDHGLRRLFPILLFLLAFLPRALGYVGSSTIWHGRAKYFFDGFLSGQWADTYQAPHPGVITMWLAGLTRWVGLLFNPDYDATPMSYRLNNELIPIALVISLTFVIAFFILKRIFGFQVSAVATVLLALDPYHISLSKVTHVDALVSSFMLLSALFLWLFIYDSRWSWVLLSGLFAGLGLLTKTPAIFLVPYFFLSMLMWQAGIWWRKRGAGDEYNWLQGITSIVKAALIWFPIMALAFFVLWPAMWIQPLETLSNTFGGTDFYRGEPHENPILFFGEVLTTDPGPFFYPVNMAVKTTAVALIGFLLSFWVLLRGRLRAHQRQALLLGFAFLFFYIVMMNLGEKKLARYMLPALQFVPLLAGIGWVYALRSLWHERKQMVQLSLAILIAMQLLIVVTRHPYYDTHFNYLLGGPRRILQNNVVSGQEFGIGVEQAGDYLNSLPLSTELVVGAQSWLDFYHYFQGKTVPLTDNKVDYALFVRNGIVRDIRPYEWQAVWDEMQNREPKYVVSFDGVPYVWVYKTGPVIDEQLISHPVNADFAGGVRLLGYDYSPQEVQPGETIRLTLYWEALEEPLGDYTVFSHLVDPDGQLRGQKDSPPQNGMYPTYLWDQNERVQDQYEITVHPDAPPGDYEFSLGMYLLETLERLPITTAAGDQPPDRSLLLPGPRVVAPN